MVDTQKFKKLVKPKRKLEIELEQKNDTLNNTPEPKLKRKKESRSTFADYIDQVVQVQTMTYPENLTTQKGYGDISLKLLRQKRLLELDTSSEESEGELFDEYNLDSSSYFLEADKLKGSFHSRTVSESSSNDSWVGGKFGLDIPITETETGSQQVDDIIQQVGNLNDDINFMSELRFQNDTVVEQNSLLQKPQLPRLSIGSIRSMRRYPNLLLSPTSSFNMLNCSRRSLLPLVENQMSTALPVTPSSKATDPTTALKSPALSALSSNASSSSSSSSSSSLESLLTLNSNLSMTSTTTVVPTSPQLKNSSVTDSPLDFLPLSDYFNFDNAQSSEFSKDDESTQFNQFHTYHHHHSGGNLALTHDVEIDRVQAKQPLNKRAMWAGRQQEMINGAAYFEEYII